VASIYQSKGPGVQLKGPEVTPGFRPVEASDQSRQILEKAASDFQRSKADITALSEFSGTLNKFLYEQVAARNKQDFDEELALVLSGDRTPDPQALQEYKQKAQVLQTAAGVEAEAVADTEEVSPALANTLLTRSPAVNGWKRYARAVGLVQLTAASTPLLLQEFMESDEPTVPIMRDGAMVLISPKEAGYSGDMAEIAAAQRVGLQQIIANAGLSGINPVILAEHLTPTVMKTQMAMATTRAAEVRKFKQEEAVEETHATMGHRIALLEDTDAAGMQALWQESTKNLAISGGMERGASNKLVAESLIRHIKALKNDKLLETFAATPLIASQPNGITVGERYRDLFESASREMESYEETLQARAKKAQDDQVADVLSAHNLILATPGATKEQIAQSFAITTEQLRAIGTPSSLNELIKLEQRGQNYNPLMAQMLQADIAAGVPHTAQSIQRLAVEGVITQEEAAGLTKVLPTSASQEKVNGMAAEILSQAKGQLQFVIADLGITQTDGASIIASFSGQMADEVKASLQQMLIANPDMSNAEMRQFYLSEIQALSRQPRFRPEIDSNGQIKVTNLEPNARVLSFNNPTTGQKVRDMSQAPAAVVQSTRANTVRDYLISPQELTQNAQAFVQGGLPTPRVRALMSVTGKDWQTFLRDQHNVRGLPFTNMSQAQASQAAQQRRALAPAAAALLVNPNADPLQRVRAWNDINAARIRQQRAAEERSFGKSTGPVDFDAAYNALVGKESGGDPSVLNRSGSGATGLGQVMPENIGPWTEKWLGRRMTQEEFRRNPEAQRRVVTAQFRQNINDQIAAGHSPEIALRRAAAIWYSGRAELHTDTKPQSWNGNRYPSVKEYADDIVRRYNSNRQGSFSGARGGRANFTPQNVQSIRIETPGPNFQPGMDLWFADKNFGAVLPGRVKEIRMNNGNYGNMIVVESTDPATGDKVDVVYAHLDSVGVREGERIRPGTIIGRQGGTGRVRSADGTIASVDFLSPAPRGSNAMTPYRGWKQLSNRIKQRIESGTFL
jgi:hypothetical protein